MKPLTTIIDDDISSKVAMLIGGEEAVKVVMFLRTIEEATIDQILEATEIKLNDIRKALFKLYNYSIVQCDRSRDKDTRWFVFRWRFQPDQIEGFIKNMKARALGILKTRLEYETNNDFFYCNTPECDRYTFEDAMEHVFKCPVCRKSLKHFDNGKIIESLNEKIRQIEKEKPN